jgi:hypothetical protein
MLRIAHRRSRGVRRRSEAAALRVTAPHSRFCASWLAFPSPLLAISMACGAISESFLVLDAEALVALAHRKRQPGCSDFPKNDTLSQSAWQEIVDFPDRASRPSIGLAARASPAPPDRRAGFQARSSRPGHRELGAGGYGEGSSANHRFPAPSALTAAIKVYTHVTWNRRKSISSPAGNVYAPPRAAGADV